MKEVVLQKQMKTKENRMCFPLLSAALLAGTGCASPGCHSICPMMLRHKSAAADSTYRLGREERSEVW